MYNSCSRCISELTSMALCNGLSYLEERRCELWGLVSSQERLYESREFGSLYLSKKTFALWWHLTRMSNRCYLKLVYGTSVLRYESPQ